MSANLRKKIKYLEELSDNIQSLAPSYLFVLNKDFAVISFNKKHCEICRFNRENIIGKNIFDIFPKSLLYDGGVGDLLHKIKKTGEPVNITGLRFVLPNSQSVRTLNLKLRIMGAERARNILLNIYDVTDRVEKIFELSMMRYVNNAIAQGDLKLKRLLNLILTCVTAGSALGFNRAFLLLVNKSGMRIKGKMAVGPASAEEAYKIWSQLGSENKTLKDFLESYNIRSEDRNSHFSNIINRMDFSMKSKENLIVKSITQKKPYKVLNALMDPDVSSDLRDLLGANEFVVVPMIVRDKSIGAIVADNLYSMDHISEEHVQLLTMFANQAGLALEVAEMYNSLKKEKNELKEAYVKIRETQDKLIEAEKLATVGKMAAYISHEIKNPLVTIGGFAKSVLKHTDNIPQTAESVKIIVKEVDRLEKILSDVLEFSKPPKTQFSPENINRVISETCLLVEREISENKIELKKELAAGLPKISIDAKQIKQAILNVLKNAIYAMPKGGSIYLSTYRADQYIKIVISDTGKGIPKELLDKLFVPFFTTKRRGSGIGLAVTNQIIKDHGGSIEVNSEEGKGTMIILNLPVVLRYNASPIAKADFY